MLTMLCRRAAGLSFLQINELTYYFTNCLLAQLTLWGTGSPGMNTVTIILPSSLVQACSDVSAASVLYSVLYGTLTQPPHEM